MISAIYAAVAALLIVWLSFGVIKLRRAKKVRFGDGNDPALQVAVRAHGNATEYIPISLILLVLLEINGAAAALIHAGGSAILIGRVIHARGLLTTNMRWRVLGMQMTFATLVALALLDVVYALRLVTHIH